MKKYDEYKDSGKPWIGEIPKDWEVKKLKYFAKIKNGQDYKNFETEENGYPVMGSGGEFARASKYMWNRPSVLLGRKGTIDKPLYIDFPFWTVDTMYYTDINSDSDAKYLYYLATTINFSYYQYGSAVPSMTQNDLANIYFSTPTTKEIQHSIADYLDRKTVAIDSLIEDKQKLIELLKEKRQAIISEAVTKGLDKNAKMKDSGIELIGEIPEDWTCTSLGKIAKIVTGNTPSKSGAENYYDDNFGMLWIKPDNLNGFNDIINTKEKLTNDGEKLARVIEPYTPLVCCIGTIGKFGYCSARAAYNQQINAVNFNTKIMQWKFGLYAISSQIEQHLFYSNGNVVNILNTENQKKIKIAVPPVNEQNNIVHYLDQKTADIDSLVADITAQIEKLKEYCQAIISEAVTGKVAI